MNSARIAALLEPFLASPLSHFQLEHISMYIDILVRWNARINLTAIRNEEEIVTRHFGESFFLAGHVIPSHSQPCHPEWSLRPALGEPVSVVPVETVRVLDIGSGAGFPAIPIKLWAPDIHLIMIESNHKKVAFLREVVRALNLADIDVIAERAETLAARPGFVRANVVTFRAVENFEGTLRQAEALLAPGGSLAVLIGVNQVQHLAAAVSISWNLPIPVPMSSSRVLSVGQTTKVG